MEVPIASIVIGERHRADLGDLCSLAKSIADIGLLQPIVVTPDYRLIAGERRIAAFRQLGREAIPVNIVDLDNVLSGEWAENAERKAFTRSEAVAIGKALEERERARARERQSLAGTLKGQASDQIPEASKGDVRDIVGARVGMAGSTYAKASVVVNAATADPETFGAIATEMDVTGNVNRAYNKVRALRREAPAESRESISARRDVRIRQMAEDSYRPEAIAQAVGVSESAVRAKLAAWGIETVTQRIGKGKRVQADSVLAAIVDNANPPEQSLALVAADWEALDRTKFPSLEAALTTAITTLSRLRQRIRKDIESDITPD